MFALLAGVWVGVFVKQWVGAQWAGAHPAVAFWALSWLVAILSGLAVVTLINVIGDRVGRAIQSGPVAWLDRTLGIAAGAVVGLGTASLLVLVAVRMPMGRNVEQALEHARTTRPLLAAGSKACERGARFPGARQLKREFVLAQRRLGREAPSI